MEYGQVWNTNINVNLSHQTVLIVACYDVMQDSWFFLLPMQKKTAVYTSPHTPKHSKSVPTCRQPCPPCNSVCVCVCVGGPTSLLLALRLKQCQQVCDETSQTIPHLSLFSILALFVSLSPRLSNTLFNHLFLSLVHYFFSLSMSVSDWSLWSSLLFSPPPLYLYITVLSLPGCQTLWCPVTSEQTSCNLEWTTEKVNKTEGSRKETVQLLLTSNKQCMLTPAF